MAPYFVAGAYTAVWDGDVLGTTENGFELEIVYFGEEITGDNYGDTVQDVVHRGGNCFINCVLEEWRQGSVNLISMFDNADPGTPGNIGMIGRMGTAIPDSGASVTGQLVLTHTTLSAAQDSPTTLTANNAIIAPGFSTRINFNSRLRKIPIRFQLLPYGDSPDERWFIMDPTAGGTS